MAEVDEFLAEVLPAQRAAEVAMHEGDAGPRGALWSHDDPVTLFGAEFSGGGWDQVGPVFEHIASRFERCVSYEYEVVAADARGDLGYIVAIEHTTAVVAGTEHTYRLRSTTIFRREDGRWRAVHRHGDPAGDRLKGLT